MASSDNGQPEEIKSRTIVLPARFTSLTQIREYVIKAAETCGLEQDAVDDVELAVDEAFSNIVEHAYGGESQKHVECTCKNDGDKLIIILKDCGKPFTPSTVPKPDLHASLVEREVGGLGMHFMCKLMDDVSYSFSTGPGGEKNCNTLTLVKNKEG